jgi:hypothetical protein
MCYDNYMIIIKCTKCKLQKPDNEFSIHHGRRNKSCIECRSRNNDWYSTDKDGRKTRAKEYYLKNKDRVAEYRSTTRLKKKYSLSKEDYEKMLKEQDYKCLIGGESFHAYKACVDHDHKTGKVRGLLCRMCNIKLYPLEHEEYRIKAESYLKSKM